MNRMSTSLRSKEYFPGKAIIIASHPRSGTHLSIDFLRKQFLECQAHLSFFETRHHAYLTLDHLSKKHKPHISQEKALSILAKAEVPIIKTHCLPDFKYLGNENIGFSENLKSISTVFYIVRDGRDVMRSTYLWRQKPSSASNYSFSEFLRVIYDGFTYPETWANHVSQWLRHPDVCILRYEDIIRNPLNELEKISQKIGINPLYKEPLLPQKRAPASRWDDYFLRLTRQFESTAIDGQHSKRQENWKDVFKPEDNLFFNKKAGNVLAQLGYI